MENSDSKGSPSCAGCLNNIGDDDYVCALNQNWHKDCFRCSVCDAGLDSWYFERAGMLFCRDDYWPRFGESCQRCAQVITGPVMAAGCHRFHPECFSCAACAAPIEDRQPYALQERSHLYCGACCGAGAAGGGGAHAIRALDVPARALRLAPDAGAAALRVTHIDASCGLLTLHIGDRVLEINGAPASQAGLDRALATPDAVLQLTIEHDPETTNNNTIDKPPPTHSNVEEDKSKADTQSPVERKILREAAKTDISERETDDAPGKKERLFKRRGEEGGKSRGMKRRQAPASPLLGDKERSSSMSKLLDAVAGAGEGAEEALGRACSFRAHAAPPYTVFRANDLLQGELLGAGFFGQVYKVTHRTTGEVMVLKQLYRVDDEAQRNFLKEVAVLRSLSHPNVLRLVGVLYREQRLHLVTEYVAGGTLRQLLQDGSRPLSWLRRGRLARDAARGVRYLHRRRVIHRDLNSHNCLVRADMTVIVADFGLARVVRRGACARRRYTVVGNPYWMAPEMMNGDVYDEKVDVFSFGIILCEIIGRVSADPDELPRRADFGLNEAAFAERFCRACPPPLYRLAFAACLLDPDLRPSFEAMAGWLERLARALQPHAAPDRALLREVLRAHQPHLHLLAKSPSSVRTVSECLALPAGRALGKCVSAGQLCVRVRGTAGTAPGSAGSAGSAGAAGEGGQGAVAHSRSQHALHRAPGFILRAHGTTIDITKVDDITQWLDGPAAVKRCSPEAPAGRGKARRVHPAPENLPAFLRNQSVEELESHSKQEAGHPSPICRHDSIPDQSRSDSDSSSDDEVSPWTASSLHMDVDRPKNFFTEIVKKGESLLAQKSSYDVADVTLRNPESVKERKIPEEDCRRYNIDHLTRSPIMAEGVKNIPKTVEPQKQPEKTSFFTKKLLSPKLSRIFKTSTGEVVRDKTEEDNKEEKSRSKFFVKRPASPRVRPQPPAATHPASTHGDLLKSDLKLASLGKPMTPIFRRHAVTERPDFVDGRFSCRERRPKNLEKFVEVGRNRIKAPEHATKLAPLIRCSPINDIPTLTTVVEKEKEGKREGISRSNYVSLANLRINGKPKPAGAPPERVV